MRKVILAMVLLASCSHESVRNLSYQVEIKNRLFVDELHKIVKKQNLQKENTVIRVVMFETASKQYMYVSPTHFSPNYKYFQPEGWFVIDNILVIICQNGELYGRIMPVQEEIDNMIKTLNINLISNDRAIVEPDGKRFIYCIQSKTMKSDDIFDKISDDECE